MEGIYAHSFGKKLDDCWKNFMLGVWFNDCINALRERHMHIDLDCSKYLCGWSQISSYSRCGRIPLVDHSEARRTTPSSGWGRDSWLIHCTDSWERGKAESYIHWKLHREAAASRMQWPELEFCQDSGIRFPSAGQNGPRDFYFYSFSITTAQQHKQAPKQCEPPRVIFPCGCHTDTTHAADLTLPKFRIESLITLFRTHHNGRKALWLPN